MKGGTTTKTTIIKQHIYEHKAKQKHTRSITINKKRKNESKTQATTT